MATGDMDFSFMKKMMFWTGRFLQVTVLLMKKLLGAEKDGW